MNQRSSGRLSLIAYLLCTVLILFTSFFFYPRWNKNAAEATIGWDVSGYYWYLPATFIYKDIRQQHFKDTILARYAPTPELQQSFRHRSGSYVMKYSSGMAIMYTPFFLVAHALARPLGYPPDGFSPPYQLALQIGSVLVCLLGLGCYRRFLRYYFSDGVVALVLLVLVFGSNYLNWSAIDGALSHNWLFTLYALLLLATKRFYEQPSVKRAVPVGLLVGMATLTRPTEVISCLIPLLWGLERLNVGKLRQRWQFFRQQYRSLLAAVMVAGLVVSLQLLYWKYATGEWIVYSYQDQGFSWKHPHFYDYTFNLNTGWLVYAPAMCLCVLGLPLILKNGPHRWMVLIFGLLNYYIVSAWDIWWYGSRAMIQSYPVILLSMAALFQWIRDRRWAQYAVAPVLLAFVYYNFWFTFNAHGVGLYDPDCMTREYFWKVVGRWKVNEEVMKLKDTNELFEGTPRHMQLLMADNGKWMLTAADTLLEPVRLMLPPPKGWVRVQTTVHCALKEWNLWHMAEMQGIFYEKGVEVKKKMIRLHRFLSDGETKPLWIDIRTPDVPYDEFRVVFFNPGSDKTTEFSQVQVLSFGE